MNVTIKVSKQRIIGGKGSVNPCPIERVLNSKPKGRKLVACVGNRTVNLGPKDSYDFVYSTRLPKVARDFVQAHDTDFQAVKPIQFNLNIPAKYLK